MDASRFDAWTRRRFGLVVGTGIAALAGASARDDADAKKKRKRKKKKRCKKLKQPCGGKKKCCKNLTCAESTANPDGKSCCHQPPGTCADATDCCGRALCEDGRCCFDTGGPCTERADCCAVFDVCEDNVCTSSN